MFDDQVTPSPWLSIEGERGPPSGTISRSERLFQPFVGLPSAQKEMFRKAVLQPAAYEWDAL
jgi:hypothetical protein